MSGLNLKNDLIKELIDKINSFDYNFYSEIEIEDIRKITKRLTRRNDVDQNMLSVILGSLMSLKYLPMNKENKNEIIKTLKHCIERI